MLLITCPWCGTRDQSEFSYGGQAHIPRPANSDKLTDAEWAEYVFMRDNPKGVWAERWVHSSGCRKWFNALRDTSTDRFYAFYKPGDPRPSPPQGVGPRTPSGEPQVGSGNDGAKVMR